MNTSAECRICLLQKPRPDAEFYAEVPDAYICVITQKIMQEPVFLLADGHTYEREALESWFETGRMISPMTGKKIISSAFKTNSDTKKAIAGFLEKYVAFTAKGLRELRESALGTAMKLRDEVFLFFSVWGGCVCVW